MPSIEASIGVRHDDIKEAIDSLPDRMAARDDAFIRDLVRGVKYVRQAGSVAGQVTHTTWPGPDSGFAWDLKIVSVTLDAVDSLAAYVGEGANARLIGYSNPGTATASAGQAVQVITWSGHQAIIYPDEGLYLTTSGTGNILTVMAASVQVPAEMLGKVLL